MSLGFPVPKLRKLIPVGYKINPENSKELIVDEPVFELLKQARKYLKECSCREVSDWLKAHGVKISHDSLLDLMRDRPPYTDDERKRYSSTKAQAS